MTVSPTPYSPRPLCVSTLMIGGTGIIAAGGQLQSLAALLTAGLGVWLLLQFITPARPIPRGPRLLIHSLILMGGWGVWLAHSGADFIEEERWAGLQTNLEHREWLEQSPAVFPSTIYDGIPQTFYVQTRDGQSSILQIGKQATTGISLGNGLFRHTLPTPLISLKPTAEITATLVVDGDSYSRTLKRVSRLAHPRWFCSSPELGMAATISEETDEGFLIHATGTHQTFTTGESPSDCLILPKSRQLLISHRYENSIWVFNLDTLELLQRIKVGPGQHRFALSPDQSHFAVVRNHLTPEVLLLSASSFKRVDQILLPLSGDWITFGESSSVILLSSKTDQSLNRYEKTDEGWKHDSIDLGRPATVMTRNHQGDLVYLATTGYSEDGPVIHENHFIQDQVLVFKTSTLTLENQFITHRQETKSKTDHDVLEWTAGGSPLGIALTDEELLLTFSGTNEVWRLSHHLKGPIIRESFHHEALQHPIGIAWLGNNAWAISSPSMGTIEIHHPQGPSLIQLAPANSTLPAHQLAQRLGEHVFYESTRTGKSCQSCHLHGDSDYAHHNLGDQEVQPSTLSIRGISGTSPYLRQGSYNQIAHLMELLDFTLGGFLDEDPKRGEHLEAFVESQPSPINPRHLSPTTEASLTKLQEGYGIFRKAQCVECHAPPAFSHLGRIPAVGLFPDFPNPTYSMDTPSLLGLWQSAPYLYDGRAPNLKSVLSKHNEANRHGDTQNLSPKEIGTLAFFLENL